jgi:hypothetical protein
MLHNVRNRRNGKGKRKEMDGKKRLMVEAIAVAIHYKRLVQTTRPIVDRL